MQTTRRSNLALGGRRFNRIFSDSYNKNKLKSFDFEKMGKQKLGISIYKSGKFLYPSKCAQQPTYGPCNVSVVHIYLFSTREQFLS